MGAAALSLAVVAAGCTPASVVPAEQTGPSTTVQASPPGAGPFPDARVRDAGRVPAGEAASPRPTDRAEQVWADEPALGPTPDAPANAETSEVAVRGYLQAAHTVEASDAGVRHRRHHAWLHPAAPGRTGGIWTPDPPPEGVTRRVEVIDLELVAAAEHGDAWAVVYRLWDGPDLHAERTRHVTTRQHGGQWFVFAETGDLQPVPH